VRLPVVAIVGRPNVGKSTLFNRLTSSRKAIVRDTPGVTRDRLHGTCEFGGWRATVIDTGGLDPTSDEPLTAQVRKQVLAAIAEADALVFVVDGREGLTSQPPSCQKCGFAFTFQLLEDYYPAQATGFIVTDQDRRVLATGEGVFELTGFGEGDLLGRDVAEALGLSDSAAIETVREWGVRKLDQQLSLRTRAGIEKKVKGDFFPAYDEDGGLLLGFTPA